MYLQHFGLRRSPFTANPDPRLFHPVRAHVEALEKLAAGIRDGQHLVGLRGPEGSGKTLLARLLVAELRERQQVVVVERSARSLGGLAAAIGRGLGLDLGDDARQVRSRIEAYLRQRHEQRLPTAVVIDEADNLPDGWLTEIESMITADVALTFVVACRQSLGAASRAPVTQRLADLMEYSVEVGSITVSECAGYLQALLMNAGARSSRLFDDAAVRALHGLAEGRPGRIGEIADRALLVAYGRGAERVDEDALLAAAEQLADGKGAPHARRAAAAQQKEMHEPISIERRRIEVVASAAEAENLVMMPRAAVAGGGSGGESLGAAWSMAAVAGAAGPARGPRGVGQTPPLPIEPEQARELLSGIRRPDRPSWDRAKHDPHRSPLPEPAPFGPEMMAVVSDPHGDAAEWFRVLRLRIEDWMSTQREERPMVLVSSAESGAGKTFVACNLALLFANEPGYRVLLVDGDLRRPRFESLFGVASRPGLADVLAGRADLASATQYISEVGLFVLPAGRGGNPRDLLSPDRFGPTLREMRADADLIIVDGPSMSAGADARSMAATADGVLFVARSGHTRAPALTRSLRALDRDNLIGTVLSGFSGRQTESSHGEFRRPGS